MKTERWANAAIVAGIWSTVIGILAITLGSPFYLGNKIDNIRTEMYSFRTAMTDEFNIFRKDMADEMKDFHGRLCAIEERNRK